MGSPTSKKNERERNRIVRAIFAAAEASGMTDRQALEQLVGQVLQRLEPGRQPLPGMEHLVTGPPRGPAPQIQTLVEEVLSKTMKTETVSEMKPADAEAMPTGSEVRLTDNALRVLEKRYLSKDKEGKVVETPEQLFRRVARCIASAEKSFSPHADVAAWEERFYRVMTRLEFLPNSPTLMNAGRELGQLSACFVLPVEDSMESIFDAVKYTALIHKSGGGTGFSFSRLRPESDRVGSTGGIASGPLSFIRAFDTATDVIKQGGMRRGANMGILDVTHPDIERFITAKEDPKALTNFNLSVAVTDGFMDAVEKGAEYELVNPRTRANAGTLNAGEVFNKIVDMAWRTGDPGIVFIDRINQFNPTPALGRIESTNPCGEQPLLPYESCNLGSLNLARTLTGSQGKPSVDYGRLAETVTMAVRFLDDVLEVNKFPLPQIKEMTRKTRKVGLGVMGFADMLVQLGVPYDSEEGIKIAEEVMRCISETALRASADLAADRGTFPAFEQSIYAGGRPLRNASRTTIAPTGTLSIISGCSSGIEPLFALSYKRHILEGEEFIEVNPYFEEVARREGFYSTELMGKLAQGEKLKDMPGVPDWVKKVFVTSHDIAPEWHVRMQAAFQKYTDNAVSKTVNFPHEATREEVAGVYRLAHKQGLKGITIYRDRSRQTQVLTLGDQKEEPAKEPGGKLTPRKRPKVTRGFSERVNTGCGNIYVTVNFDDRGICEVFSSLGKAGGCAQAQLEATSRLISLALRSGVDSASVVKHLRGIRCPSIAWEEGHAVLSCADAIASVLEKHVTEGPAPEAEDFGLVKNWAGQCPDCGASLIYQEGCHICPACGYTKCS